MMRSRKSIAIEALMSYRNMVTRIDGPGRWYKTRRV